MAIYNPNTKVSNIPVALEGQVEASELVVTGLTGGVYEVQTITCPATAAATQADYFVVTNSAGTKFAVWLDIDANGTAPTGAAYVASDVQIMASIATGNTASQVAAAVVSAWGTQSGFSIAQNSADVVFTSNLYGNITAPAVHNAGDLGAGSFVAVTTTGGSLPTDNSKYFTFSSNSTLYYAWLNINGGGSDPAPGGTGVEVALTGNESASGVASAIAAAVTALSGITATADGNVVYIQNDTKANVLNGSAGDWGMVFKVQAQGGAAVFYPSLAVDSISNNPSVLPDVT